MFYQVRRLQRNKSGHTERNGHVLFLVAAAGFVVVLYHYRRAQSTSAAHNMSRQYNTLRRRLQRSTGANGIGRL